MIFIDHVPVKVGVANTHWVIYILVSNIPAHMYMKKNNFNDLRVLPKSQFLIELEPCDIKFES